MYKISFLLLAMAAEGYIMHTAFARWFGLNELISLAAAWLCAIGFLVFLVLALIKSFKSPN